MRGQPSGQPIPPSERILALDVLRGFAMAGVLVAYCLWNLGTAPEESWSPLDRTLGEIAALIIDGKFYTILAFLFGLGFSIQLGRAASDASAVDLYCRRLAILAGIGLAHSLLLRNGDILLPYALTGFLLIPFRNAGSRTLFAAAVVALAVSPTVTLVAAQLGWAVPDRPHLTGSSYLVENMAWAQYWLRTAIFTWPTNLTLFLFGLYAGRHQLLQRLANRPRALVLIILGGIFAGGLLHGARLELVDMSTASGRAAAGLLFTFHCLGMSSGYAAAIILGLRSQAAAVILAPLAAIGRLALTNYLGQAALIVPLCLAFGWFDRFTPITSLSLALAVFLVQLAFSLLWVRRFSLGPAEWLWRSLTYGRPLELGPRVDNASA